MKWNNDPRKEAGLVTVIGLNPSRQSHTNYVKTYKTYKVTAQSYEVWLVDQGQSENTTHISKTSNTCS